MTLPTRKLDEIVELRAEKSNGRKYANRPYVGLEHIAQGSPRLLGWLPSEASVSANNLFEKDDILFGKLRPNLRKSIRAPFAGYCSTDILVLRALEGIAPRFAGHVFQWENVFNVASATAAGTKMPRTSWNELRRFRTFCPESTNEQMRIAVVLDTIDAAIERTTAVIGKLKQVRAGLLHDLLTRGLDDNGELRDPDKHPEQFHDSPLGRIPKAWEADRLSTFLASTEYGISTSLSDKGILPVLRMNNLHQGEASLDDLRFATIAVPDALLLRDGDVLFNRTNSYEHVGRTGIWRSQLNRATFASYLVRLNPNPERLTSEMLNLILNMPESQIRMRRFATPAVQQVNINPTSLQQMHVAVPSSLPEQDEIMRQTRGSAVAIATALDELRKLKSLKSGLMSDLLTGRVSVPETIATGAAP
jgi:type I restriction enzyme S subunit